MLIDLCVFYTFLHGVSMALFGFVEETRAVP